MLSKCSRRSAGLVLALILISGPLNRSWAQSLSFSDTAPRDAVQLKRVAVQVLKVRSDTVAASSAAC